MTNTLRKLVMVIVTTLLLTGVAIPAIDKKPDAAKEEQEAAENKLAEFGGKVERYYLQDLRDTNLSDQEIKQLISDILKDKSKFASIKPSLSELSELKQCKTDDECIRMLESKTVVFLNTSFNDDDLSKVMDQLPKIQHLKKIDFSYTKITGRDLNKLFTKLKGQKVTDIDLSGTPLSDAGLCNLASLAKTEKISKMWLSGTILTHSRLLEFMKAYKEKPIELYLANTTVVERKGTSINEPLVTVSIDSWLCSKSMPELTLITGLDLSGTGLTEKGLVALLGGNKVNPGLRKLRLAGNKLKDEGLDKIKTFTELEVLDLADNKGITDKGLRDLLTNDGRNMLEANNLKTLIGDNLKLKPKVSALTELKELSLAGTGNPSDRSGTVTDNGIFCILFQNQNSLVKLNLSSTATLASKKDSLNAGILIRKLTKLESLNISGTGIDNSGLVKIWEPDKELPKPLDGLRSLDISKTRVTNKGLINDGNIVGLRNLRTIEIGDTKVTTGGINNRNALLAITFPGTSGTKALRTQ